MKRSLEEGALVGVKCTPHAKSDNEVVLDHNQGDRRAFEELHRRYSRRLFKFLLGMVGDRERCEDIVQDTFFRVFKHLNRFDQKKKFSTWIYTIASNLAKNEIRNRKRNPIILFQTFVKDEAEEHPPEFRDDKLGPERMMRANLARNVLAEALASLPYKRRQILCLRRIEGLTILEVSKITGYPIGTVKSGTHRAEVEVTKFAKAKMG